MKMAKTKEDRKHEMLRYLQENQFAQINELADSLGFSVSTVKRDLKELDEEGLIRRTRGGAIPVDQEKVDMSYLMKLSTHTSDDEKKEVAEKAVAYIKDDMVLFMDSSSTTLQMIPLLKKFEGLRIVTNSVLTAALLSEYTSSEVIIVGGSVSRKKFTVHSTTALKQLKSYCVDKAFISCRGYDEKQGLTENSEGEALMKQELREIAKEIILLTTPEKRNKVYMFQGLTPEQIDLVL